MSRRKAREIALQALFHLDFNDAGQREAIEAALGEEEKLSDSALAYAKEIVEGVLAHLEEIDRRIGEGSTEWKVERMPGVDRNITRIAVYEMRLGKEELTPNIVINEAVELAKKFGTDASARFVNGVLGKMIKSD